MKKKFKNVLVIVGHPRKKSLNHSIADEYEKGAKKNGHFVKRLNLIDLKFDEILKNDLERTKHLEPDLKKAQKDIMWADHLVFVYPTWWGTMPALLKGFIDRIFLPGFAYDYHRKEKKKRFNPFPDRLLKGKSARVITTVGGGKLIYTFLTNPGTWGLRFFVFYFSGIRPVRTTMFSRIRPHMSKGKVKRILNKARKLGMKAK